MPVHRHKKDTTPTVPSSTPEQPAPALPDQQTFQQFLRELARSAIRVVLEGVMREALDALIGVGWGECSPSVRGIVTAPTAVIWSRRRVGLRRSRFPETGRGSSTPRSSTATAVTNPRWRKASPRCLWPESARDIRRRSRSNADGSRGKPPVRSVVSIGRSPSNLTPGENVRCKSTGAFCIWMECISASDMGTKPTPPSS